VSGATLVVARRIAALGTAVILIGPAPALAQGATLARDSLAARAASAPGRPVAAPDTLAPRLPVVRRDALAAGDAEGIAAADSLAGGEAMAINPAAPVPAPPPRDYVAEARANFTAENRSYAGTRTALGFVEPFYALLVALLILFSGLAAKLRDLACRLSRRLYFQVLVFLTLYTVVDFVLGFPFAWYQGYALERQYGLSTQSFAAWLGDEGKGVGVTLIVYGLVPVLWLIYRAIARWPRGWWFPVALGTLPLILAGALIQPLVIDPLYNRFTPLHDQHLKGRILELAAWGDVPARNVYEVDKSEQTVKYNAYVNGFGASQRIVLWDTTLRGMREDEILFVVGHEMGHYRLGHIWRGIVLYSLGSFLLFFLISRFAGGTLRRFGSHWDIRELKDVASMPLLAAMLSLFSLVGQPVINAYSRRVEHEADAFAVELTRDNDAGARAFLKLGSQNRDDPEPSRFVTFYQYSHPPLMERIRFALAYRPWEQGKPNRYFHRPTARR